MPARAPRAASRISQGLERHAGRHGCPCGHDDQLETPRRPCDTIRRPRLKCTAIVHRAKCYDSLPIMNLSVSVHMRLQYELCATWASAYIDDSRVCLITDHGLHFRPLAAVVGAGGTKHSRLTNSFRHAASCRGKPAFSEVVWHSWHACGKPQFGEVCHATNVGGTGFRAS
jgi:hypothetical protein